MPCSLGQRRTDQMYLVSKYRREITTSSWTTVCRCKMLLRDFFSRFLAVFVRKFSTLFWKLLVIRHWFDWTKFRNRWESNVKFVRVVDSLRLVFVFAALVKQKLSMFCWLFIVIWLHKYEFYALSRVLMIVSAHFIFDVCKIRLVAQLLVVVWHILFKN